MVTFGRTKLINWLKKHRKDYKILNILEYNGTYHVKLEKDNKTHIETLYYQEL